METLRWSFKVSLDACFMVPGRSPRGGASWPLPFLSSRLPNPCPRPFLTRLGHYPLLSCPCFALSPCPLATPSPLLPFPHAPWPPPLHSCPFPMPLGHFPLILFTLALSLSSHPLAISPYSLFPRFPSPFSFKSCSSLRSYILFHPSISF